MPLTPGMKIWIDSDTFWISYNVFSRLMNEILSDVLDIYIAVGSHGFFSPEKTSLHKTHVQEFLESFS